MSQKKVLLHCYRQNGDKFLCVRQPLRFFHSTEYKHEYYVMPKFCTVTSIWCKIFRVNLGTTDVISGACSIPVSEKVYTEFWSENVNGDNTEKT